MFAQFGHKWLCLHRGPVWQYEECEEREMGPVKSLVEIALDESGINLESLESGDVEVTVSQSEYEQSFNEDFLSHGESLEAMESTFHCLSLSGHPSDRVDSGELLRDYRAWMCHLYCQSIMAVVVLLMTVAEKVNKQMFWEKIKHSVFHIYGLM